MVVKRFLPQRSTADSKGVVDSTDAGIIRREVPRWKTMPKP